LANGAPLIAKRLFGSALAFPLDNGVTLADGEPPFGHSKTLRGVALSVAVSTLGAPWTGLPSTAGLLVSAMAMIGDLLSSFVKRRMKLVPGSMALALDQIPESLLPAIAARWVVLDIIFVTGLFLSANSSLRVFYLRLISGTAISGTALTELRPCLSDRRY
jgi:hypothetical protein